MKDETLYTLLFAFVQSTYISFDYDDIVSDMMRNEYFHSEDENRIFAMLRDVVEEINSNY